MPITLSTLVQPFSNWTFVKRLFNQSELNTQEDLELDIFLKPHFDRGVFLNGSSSF